MQLATVFESLLETVVRQVLLMGVCPRGEGGHRYAFKGHVALLQILGLFWLFAPIVGVAVLGEFAIFDFQDRFE